MTYKLGDVDSHPCSQSDNTRVHICIHLPNSIDLDIKSHLKDFNLSIWKDLVMSVSLSPALCPDKGPWTSQMTPHLYISPANLSAWVYIIPLPPDPAPFHPTPPWPLAPFRLGHLPRMGRRRGVTYFLIYTHQIRSGVLRTDLDVIDTQQNPVCDRGLSWVQRVNSAVGIPRSGT